VNIDSMMLITGLVVELWKLSINLVF